MNIPKVMHQIWIGDKKRPVAWMDTWKDKHPGWEYKLWDNEAVKNHGAFKLQRIIDHYTNQKIYCGAADCIRYEILFEQGGVMPAADMECIAPIDELFDNENDLYCMYENEKARPGYISPVFASCKENPFVNTLIYGLLKLNKIGKPWRTTGNLYMKAMVETMKPPRLKIFPSHYFIPEHFTGVKYNGTDKIYANNYWGTTKNAY